MTAISEIKPIAIVKEDKNELGQPIYQEYANGVWVRIEYDTYGFGMETYVEHSPGDWFAIWYMDEGHQFPLTDCQKLKIDKARAELNKGWWERTEYNFLGLETRWENSSGRWRNAEYNDVGKLISSDSSDRFSFKRWLWSLFNFKVNKV